MLGGGGTNLCEVWSPSALSESGRMPPGNAQMRLFCLWSVPEKLSPPATQVPEACTLKVCLPVSSLSLTWTAAGVHSPPGLPLASSGQRGNQRDEGAEGAQWEHAPEHLTQPRGPPFPGEGPRQRGEPRLVWGSENKGQWAWWADRIDPKLPENSSVLLWAHDSGSHAGHLMPGHQTAQHCETNTQPPQPRVPHLQDGHKMSIARPNWNCGVLYMCVHIFFIYMYI